jgi:outer membrane protein OmpA-like peptidoglycan-associated protein
MSLFLSSLYETGSNRSSNTTEDRNQNGGSFMSVQNRNKLQQALKPLALTAALAIATTVPAETAPTLHAACNPNATMARGQPAADLVLCSFTVILTTGDAILGPETRRALDRAAPRIIAHLASGGRVLIEGYADAGTPLETPQLSLRRAEAVATYLDVAWGIPTRRLTLRDWGAALTDGRDLPQTAQNQRVTITLHSSGANMLTRLTEFQSFRAGHLDLDDFGGARNPLPGPRVRLWLNPDASQD